jgi:murein DD-endopeptidase MepM/ murein hydrolase activator NlpD
MPHASHAYQHSRQHPAHATRPVPAHTRNDGFQRHGQAPSRGASTDYALVHGGRQVRIGPIAFWICTGALVIMAGWTLMTATYFAFKDDVLTRLVARQAQMQSAYEDRIADMRTQVDRITSRQMLDQEQIEQKLDQIARKQAVLESRAATLSTLADPATTGSIRPSLRDNGKPRPIGDGAQLEPRGFSALVARVTGKFHPGGVTAKLARLEESLDKVETRQSQSLDAMEASFNSKANRIRSALKEAGIDAGKASAGEAMGGPFVPLRSIPNGNSFEKHVRRITLARAQVDQLSRTVQRVPLRQPLPGELDLSSGFGVRVDPFFRRPAMHTGLDMRGESGDPVRATATGTVTHAGWQGGYGKLVEIDHGNGLATRYGHLSEIEVHVGQRIKIGQIVGRIGSTGRSTGPHLHYETRVGGDAVDPHRFLRAGAKLGLAS